ncbi:hypothetical protein D3C72_2582900 [compost metagenome]
MGLSPSGWRFAAVGIPLESLQFSVFGGDGWEPLPFRHDISEDELRRLSDFEV